MTESIYYRVTGGEPLAFCQDWLMRYRKRGSELTAWAEAHGAKGWVPGRGRAIGGLIFERDTAPDANVWKARRGKTLDGHVSFAPGHRTPEGKALNKEMDAMVHLPSHDEFCARFNFPLKIEYNGENRSGIATTRPWGQPTTYIGWFGEQFWIALPDVAARVAEYEANGFTVTPAAWVVPDGMEPKTLAHYDLAAAQYEVDRVEAAA